METGTATNLVVTPGRQHFHPGHPKVWAVIDVSGGTPSLTTSYNVTSVTDSATGVVGITIANDFSSASWCGNATTHGTPTGYAHTGTKAAGSILVGSRDAAGTLTDPDQYNFVAHGDL